MRIQYCSDLHLELEQNLQYLTAYPLKVSGDILILAGDIAPLRDEFLNNAFFTFIAENYTHVYWVPGNHEFFHKDMADFGKSYQMQIRNNITIVNNIALKTEGINFIFSTLWSEISEENAKNIEKNVPDFESITINSKKFKVTDFNKLHFESLEFVKQALSDRDGKTVVVTHHLPTLLCNSAVHNESSINEAFCVDLTDYINESNVNFWLHGHSHFNHNPLIIGNTLMLTNQFGYFHFAEHANFKRNAYFSI